SASNESAFSHAALFTGLFPSEVALPRYEEFAIPETATTVGGILQNYGYSTAAFMAGGHVSEHFGFDNGFQSFRAEKGFASFWDTTPRALEWLDSQESGDPWMLVVHGYDAHRPYILPEPFYDMFVKQKGSELAEQLIRSGEDSERVYKRRFYPDAPIDWFLHVSGNRIPDPRSYERLRFTADSIHRGLELTDQDVQYLQAHYDSMVAYADLQVGLFLAAAERSGYLDNTLVIVTSDHGEDLLDHEFVNHRTALTDSCVRVPLVVAGPGFPVGTRIESLAHATDIVPTVLKAAGATALAASRGIPLQELAAGTASDRSEVYFEGVMDMLAVRTESRKLVWYGSELESPQLTLQLSKAPLRAETFDLFDLENDPGEQTDLLEAGTPEVLAQAEALRSRLVDWRTTMAAGTHHQSLEDLDPDVRKEMREHGYWELGENEKQGGDPATEAAPAPTGE
ncbi:MAG: sulfatase-like hydrolase/transferase, partial [Myxococcota bacterium]|nr:sulfatase-like hydrolase/transferase [Myxococcota bacterium]